MTPKKIEGLSGVERDLTQLCQRLDQRLTFNAANFQHYVKSGRGTNFILVSLPLYGDYIRTNISQVHF